ncbi:MAG: OadG family protein [Romboutsia sp.]
MNISELLNTLKTDIATMSIGEKLLGGFSTALLAMIVVFTILVLIAFIIRIINAQPKEVEKIKEVETNKIVEEKLEDSTELTAIITAAIVASSNKNIVVRRITRTNNVKSNWEKA